MELVLIRDSFIREHPKSRKYDTLLLILPYLNQSQHTIIVCRFIWKILHTCVPTSVTLSIIFFNLENSILYSGVNCVSWILKKFSLWNNVQLNVLFSCSILSAYLQKLGRNIQCLLTNMQTIMIC